MLTSVQRYVVELSVQALLYGIYLETLTQCIRWIIFTDEGWKPREKIPSISLAFATVAIFIFFMFTTNLVATLEFMLEILIRAERWHMHDTGIVMSISEFLALLSIDGALIFRCWIVYGKSWRVICVPVTFWLGSLTCSALSTYYGTLNFSSQNFNVFQIGEMVLIGLYVCNIATTIYATTAIIYRIWYPMKAGGSSPRKLKDIMRILAESGIIYTCTAIFRLVGAVLTTRNDATWVSMVIADIADPINFSMAGITFNLILIRVYQSRVGLQDSFADSRNIDGERTLSGMQYNNSRIIASSERPTSNLLDKTTDEIQEYRRSSEGMDKM